MGDRAAGLSYDGDGRLACYGVAMNPFRHWLAAPCICALVSVMLSACAEGLTTRGTTMHGLEIGEVRVTGHRGHDDLLSAGLGLRF